MKMVAPVYWFFVVVLIGISPALLAAESGEQGEKGVFSGNVNAIHPDWFKESFLDFAEDIDEAASEGKRLALYFWQPGCPYCNQLWAHNMAVEGIEQQFRSNFDVVALNMWGDQEVVTVAGKQFTEKQLARALDVDFTPTLLFYDENKQNILRLNGYLPPEKFKLALHYARSEHVPAQSFGEYILAQQADHGGKLARSQDFFQPVDQALSNRKAQPATRPLAVIFEIPDCETCEQFHDVTLGQHPETRQLLEQMDVVQLNALADNSIVTPDGETTTPKQWAQTLGLSYYPSIALFDEQGEQVMLMNAYFRHFHTQSVFAYVLEKAYLNQPSFQRYISARADALIEQGLDVDIWQE